MVFPAPSRLLPYVALLCLTFGLTLGGILARPIESLSLFWPVNAVLAGVLLRHPRQATLAGFSLVWLAMVGADLLCGSAWLPALWLRIHIEIDECYLAVSSTCILQCRQYSLLQSLQRQFQLSFHLQRIFHLPFHLHCCD